MKLRPRRRSDDPGYPARSPRGPRRGQSFRSLAAAAGASAALLLGGCGAPQHEPVPMPGTPREVAIEPLPAEHLGSEAVAPVVDDGPVVIPVVTPVVHDTPVVYELEPEIEPSPPPPGGEEEPRLAGGRRPVDLP